MSLSVSIRNSNGTKNYSNFLSGSVLSRLDHLCRSFSLELLVDPSVVFPIALGDSCEIQIDGELVLTGFIEQITGSGNSNKNRIRIKGRDKNSDLVDSNIDVISDFNGAASLKSIIEQIISHIRADIDVFDYSTKSYLFQQLLNKQITSGRFANLLVTAPFAIEQGESALAPEPGDLCFDYISELAAAKSVVLTSTPSGDLAIYRMGNTTKTINSPLVNRVRDKSKNNILSYSFNYDNSKRYFLYTVKSTQSLASTVFSQSTESDNTEIVSQFGVEIDGLVRDSRRFVFVNTKTGDSVQQQARAAWERDARISKSRVYKCTVPGFRNSEGDVWEVNTIVEVIDDYARINDSFLINSVNFIYGKDGPISEIEVVSKDSYKLTQGKTLLDNIKSGKNFDNAFSLESTLEEQEPIDDDAVQGPTRFVADDFFPE